MNTSKLRVGHVRSRETGAILAVTLFFLFVFTFVVVASVSNTSLNEKMVANSQNRDSTFQAAESVAHQTVSDVMDGDLTMLEEARVATSGYSNTTSVTLGSSKVSGSVSARYLSDITLTSGQSLNADTSASTISGARFEIIAVGGMSTGAAMTTTVRQGLDYH